MKRTASTCVMILTAVAGLHGQEVRRATPFPPDIVAATITVTGIDGKSAALSLTELAKLPQQTFKATSHGTPVAFHGVLLPDVLSKVSLPTGEKFHSTAASYYLVVEARDGYRAAFAWAELDSTFTDKPVYLVTERDGQPLSDKDGPFQLVVPGEKRDGRWVRQITALQVRKAN